MSDNNRQIKRTYEPLPLDPEKNPPESIEELEKLIDKLQEKAHSIKHQLEAVTIREKQGLDVDYRHVRRAIYAKTRTNISIAALQRILKRKRQQEAIKAGFSFEKFFFEAAKDKLPTSLFTEVMEYTFATMQQVEENKRK